MSIIKKVLATILIAMMLVNNMSMLIVYGKDIFDSTESAQNNEPSLTSTKYIISEEENLVTRVLPETTVSILKGKFNMLKSHVKVYESKESLVEVAEDAYVATGMAIAVEGISKVYEISVIGDLNKDGQMGQIELSLIIQHIVNSTESSIEGILAQSADINGDGRIDQIDVTVLIRWIVYNELEIEEVKMPEAPNINVIQGTLEEEGFYNDKVILEIVAPEDEEIELEKITYIMTKKENTTETEENNAQENNTQESDAQENNAQEEIEIKSGSRLELVEDGIYEIKAYSYSKQGYKSVENKLEIKIDKLDKIKPEGILEVTEQTTKSLKVEVKEAKDEQSGIESYTYYIGTKNDEGEYEYREVKKYIEGQEDQGQNTEGQKLKCTFENLKQDEEYKIVVEIKDKAGNINRIEKNVRTKSMPKISATDIEIGYSNTNWTKENVEVTIKVKDEIDLEECTLEYSLDGGKTWETYEAEVKVEISKNTNIIVKLTDGENNLEVATGRVSNIDKDMPKGVLTVKEARSNRIVVDLEGIDYTSGVARYIYYIGTENEEGEIEYKEYTRKELDKKPGEELKERFTYKELDKDTKYYVKVEVEDKAGNKIELFGEEKTQKVPALNEQNMRFEQSEKNWTKKDVIVRVELDEDVDQEEFHVEYSLDDGQTWNNYDPETGIVVDHNTNVDVRLSDGKNAGETNSLTINNIDKTAPEVTITKKEATSSTITVEVEALEEQSGIEKYIYYLGKKNESGNIEYEKYTETTENSYVYEELDQNTDYYIKVEVVDNVGNVGKAEGTIKTVRITAATEVIKLTQDRKEWTKGNVIVTILYKATVYDVEYSIDGEHWKKSTESGERITIEENTTVYARLTDGKNVGEAIELEITNIDKIVPEVKGFEVLQTRSDGFTEEIHVIDNLSGISSITWYIRKQGEEQYKEEKETLTVQQGLKEGSTNVTKQKTFKGLKTGTYETYAQVFDVSGNKVETKVNEVTLKEVEGLNEDNTTITLAPENWTNQNVEVTIETQVKREGIEGYEVEDYSIEYSLDGENYYKYIKPVEVERNGKIYARLTDGKNAGEAISKDITNIDKAKPEVGKIEAVEITSKRIKASIEMKDILSGLGKIDWFYRNEKNEEYTKEEVIYTKLNESETGRTDQVTGTLDLNEIESGIYSIYAEVYDVAGNMVQTQVILIETRQIPSGEGAFTMKADPTTWTNRPVNVTMESKALGYNIQYSTNGGESWSEGTSETATALISSNGTIHARLTDGLNHGESKSLKIENIDTENPKVGTIKEVSKTSNKIVASLSAEDTLSGLAKVEWHYKKSDESEYTTDVKEWQKMNESEKGPNIEEVSQLVLENLTSEATYDIYAIVYDVAGNKVDVAKVSMTTEKVPSLAEGESITFNHTPTKWTNDNVIVSMTTTKNTNYTLEYSIDEGEWSRYTGSITLEHNATVHARLTDGENIGGEASTTISNIDKQAPTITSAKGSTETGNTGTITVTGIADTKNGITDNQSGISAISITKSSEVYEWMSIKEDSYTKKVEGAESNTKWYIYVQDVAGNVSSEAKEVTVSGIEERVSDFFLSTPNINLYIGDTEDIEITYNGKASSVTYTSNNIEIAKVTSQNGKKATIEGVSEGITNIIILATNYDGTKIGATATVIVQKRNTAPQIESIGIEEKGTNYITVKAKANDIDGDRLSYVLKLGTNANNLDIISDAKDALQGQEVSIKVNGLAEYTDYYYEVEVSDMCNAKDNEKSTKSEKTYCSGTGETCEGPFTTTKNCPTCDGKRNINCRALGIEHFGVDYGSPYFRCLQPGCTLEYPNARFNGDRCNGCGGIIQTTWSCTSGHSGSIPGTCKNEQITCPTCEGTGTITVEKRCEHGQTSEHSCCEHSKTEKHDN